MIKDRNLLSYSQSYLLKKLIESGVALSNLYICDFRQYIKDGYYTTILPLYDIRSITLPQIKEVGTELPYINQTIAINITPNLSSKTIKIIYDVDKNYSNFNKINSLMLYGEKVNSINVYIFGLKNGEVQNFRSLKDMTLEDLGDTSNLSNEYIDYELLDPNGRLDRLGEITFDDFKNQLNLISGDYGIIKSLKFKNCTILSNTLNTTNYSYTNSSKIQATCNIHFSTIE